MPALSDVRFDAMRALGHIGATSDMLLEWLSANGGGKSSIPDGWHNMLAFQLSGFDITASGQRSDDWYQLLGVLGHTGAMNDRELSFWLAGGTFIPVVTLANITTEAGDPLTTEAGDRLVA